MGFPSPPLPHIAVFPFMAKGHTIPLLHLAHLLHRRRLAAVTFFTTPLNAPFLRRSLAGTVAAVVELPFPQNHPDLPSNVESLPSMSLLLPFVRAADQLRPHFEATLEILLPPVTFLISDGFLGWTNDSAAKFGIPRIAFYPMSASAMAITNSFLIGNPPHGGPAIEDQNPHVRLAIEFFRDAMRTTSESDGVIINSFRELEAANFDSIGPKAWCVGPVCMAAQPKERPEVMEWLDSRSEVLYVAFGTLAELPELQMLEIAAGLERSGLDFIWVLGDSTKNLEEGFERRVADRGRLVRDWVEQVEILRHESVRGFVSHCGWNSVVEAVSTGVPILAWPATEEQKLNAGLAVEELRVGIRVPTSDRVVGREDVERMVRELLVGEKGKEAAERAKKLADKAERAMAPGGSSWCALELMVDKMSGQKSLGSIRGIDINE